MCAFFLFLLLLCLFFFISFVRSFLFYFSFSLYIYKLQLSDATICAISASYISSKLLASSFFFFFHSVADFKWVFFLCSVRRTEKFSWWNWMGQWCWNKEEDDDEVNDDKRFSWKSWWHKNLCQLENQDQRNETEWKWWKERKKEIKPLTQTYLTYITLCVVRVMNYLNRNIFRSIHFIQIIMAWNHQPYKQWIMKMRRREKEKTSYYLQLAAFFGYVY